MLHHGRPRARGPSATFATTSAPKSAISEARPSRSSAKSSAMTTRSGGCSTRTILPPPAAPGWPSGSPPRPSVWHARSAACSRGVPFFPHQRSTSRRVRCPLVPHRREPDARSPTLMAAVQERHVEGDEVDFHVVVRLMLISHALTWDQREAEAAAQERLTSVLDRLPGDGCRRRRRGGLCRPGRRDPGTRIRRKFVAGWISNTLICPRSRPRPPRRLGQDVPGAPSRRPASVPAVPSSRPPRTSHGPHPPGRRTVSIDAAPREALCQGPLPATNACISARSAWTMRTVSVRPTRRAAPASPPGAGRAPPGRPGSAGTSDRSTQRSPTARPSRPTSSPAVPRGPVDVALRRPGRIPGTPRLARIASTRALTIVQLGVDDVLERLDRGPTRRVRAGVPAAPGRPARSPPTGPRRCGASTASGR